MKATIFSINGMAMTSRLECEISAEYQRNTKTFISCTWKDTPRARKVKSRVFDTSDCIVLEGWNLPIKSDMDFDSFMGNACYNLVGDADVLRGLVDNAKYPVPATTKGEILLWNKKDNCEEPDGLLYPEFANLSHAVIESYVTRFVIDSVDSIVLELNQNS